MNWSPLGPGTPVPPNYKCDTNGEDACVKLEESKKANIVGLQCSTWSGKSTGKSLPIILRIAAHIRTAAEKYLPSTVRLRSPSCSANASV